MATSQEATTEAKRNQVPPALRKWANEDCDDVEYIRRFDPENESLRRGWTIQCKSAYLASVPDGFRFGWVSNSVFDMTRIQVVED